MELKCTIEDYPCYRSNRTFMELKYKYSKMLEKAVMF